MIWPRKRRDLVSLLSLIIGPGAFGIEQQTLLQLGYELHFSRSALLATWFWSRSEWCIFGYFQHQPQLRICKTMFYLTQRLHINWLRGPMARRLTTNQEIPGSTPGVIIVLHLFWTLFRRCVRSSSARLWIFLFATSLTNYSYNNALCF